MSHHKPHPGTMKAKEYFEYYGDPKTILIVENSDSQLAAIKSQLQEFWPHWRVLQTLNIDDTMSKLQEMANHPPDLVSVDLGLETREDDPYFGLRLLRMINEQYHGIPLAVHSSLPPNPETTHAIIAIPASYIRVRDTAAVTAYCAVMPFLCNGFMVYSPATAARFGDSVAVKPDPLNNDDWDLLKMLAQINPPLTYAQIANSYLLTEQTITSHVARIAHKLIDSSYGQELDLHEDSGTEPGKYREKCAMFYERYHSRFGR